MDRNYILNSSLNVARLSRLLAKAIDLFIVAILSFFFHPLGVLLSVVYLAVGDFLQNGQSVGKKVIGLGVISLEDGSPCSLKQSAIRNLPLYLPLFFSVFPFWGPFLSLLLGLPMVVLEIYLMYKLDSGHRLGDVMADTSVMAHDGPQAVSSKRKQSWFEQDRSPEAP